MRRYEKKRRNASRSALSLLLRSIIISTNALACNPTQNDPVFIMDVSTRRIFQKPFTAASPQGFPVNRSSLPEWTHRIRFFDGRHNDIQSTIERLDCDAALSSQRLEQVSQRASQSAYKKVARTGVDSSKCDIQHVFIHCADQCFSGSPVALSSSVFRVTGNPSTRCLHSICRSPKEPGRRALMKQGTKLSKKKKRQHNPITLCCISFKTSSCYSFRSTWRSEIEKSFFVLLCFL